MLVRLACEKDVTDQLTSEVVTTNVVNLGILNELPDFGGLQVLKIVLVGSTEISAQASVVAGNDNTATASGLLGVNTVLDSETSSLDCIAEDGGVLVVTNTTKVNDAVIRQHVLGTTGGVLGSTTGNQLGLIVVEEVLIDGNVLGGIGKNGVVGLELVLVEQFLVANGLDVWTR